MKKSNSKIEIKNDKVKMSVMSETNEDINVEKAMPIDLIAKKIKEEQGLKEVFITEVADIEIIWRKLKRSEYKEIMTNEYPENEDLAFYEKQEAIARKVILYPENAEELIEEFAGISDIVASETMVKTGFGLTNPKAV